MELHEILSTLKEEKDMKQHEVAEKVHVTKSAISSYETGSSQPSYSVLVALADLYDVSIDFLDLIAKLVIMLYENEQYRKKRKNNKNN